MSGPPIIGNNAQIWKANTGQDPAKFLVDPNTGLYHGPATLHVGTAVFEWPMTEGFSKAGQSQLGVHHYLGDDFPVVQVTHRGDTRISLTGTFAGRTAPDLMQDLELLLRAPAPTGGKKLFVPGAFSNEQIVEVESYNFNHASDDQTHSIEYEITFITTNIGRKVNDPHGTPAVPNPTPGKKSTPKGQDANVVTTRDGARTVRTLAAEIYNDPDMASALVSRNADILDQFVDLDMPLYQLVTTFLPLGVQLRY